ncbi:hypothetical protein E4U53_002337 [Claviceps sorghi]|nr:hypothetical protein E4U53_002337 [Claviceps sorghi]
MVYDLNIAWSPSTTPERLLQTLSLASSLGYATLLAADGRGRANFISNATSLFRATRGRGILLSSEAKNALALRGPADVVNLLSVWGLARERGMDGLRSVPRSVVVNEGIKRNGFRGVVNVVQVATRDGSDAPASASAQRGEDQQQSMAAEPDRGRGKRKASMQKRKNGDVDGLPPRIRQAKKIKVAAEMEGKTS